MRRALVTGAAGFIGRHLAARLAADGWAVEAVDDLSGGSAPFPGMRRARVQDCRPGDFAPLAAVFHLASPVGPLGVLHEPESTVPEIISGATAAAAVARAHDAVLVAIGTSESYGAHPGPTREEDDCVFAAHVTARQAYGVGKRAAETMLALVPGLDVRIVRPFNVAGPGQRAGGGFVLPRWIDQAGRGVPLTLYAPGTQVRAFCHVGDFVNGLLAVRDRGAPGRVYNLGSPANAITLAGLASIFADEWARRGGRRPSIAVVDPIAVHGPSFAEAPDKVPLIDRAVGELGWRPTLGVEAIIGDAIDAARVRRAVA